MSDADETELPRSLALAWGVAAHPQRGPKRELSIERIVEAAIAIADDGGMAAVSMAAVASSLGFTPMSLYRYVSAKDDLIVLMQDAAIGVPPETVHEVREADGWRAGLRVWGEANVDVYRRHPWVLDAPVTSTTATPNSAAWLDTGLGLLAGLPLDEVEKVAVVLAIMGQTRWQGLVERSYLDAARAYGTDVAAIDTDQEALMRRLISADAYPSLATALAGDAFAPGGADPFAFGLTRMLDGIEHHVAARAAGQPAEVEPEPDPLAHAVASDPKVKEAARARREAEKQLREARKRERERTRDARERLRRG